MDTKKPHPGINYKGSSTESHHFDANPQEPLLEAHRQEPMLAAAPEEQLLEAHKEPQRLVAHKTHQEAAMTGFTANGGEKMPPTTDAQEATGVFRGAGWVALAVLALMVLAACLWPPNFNDRSMQPVTVMNTGVPQYGIYKVTGYRTPDGYVADRTEDVVISDSIAKFVEAVALSEEIDASATKGHPTAVIVYLFDTDSSSIPENASLTEVADQADRSGKTVVIRAYTDETGNAAYNQRLSEKRAKAVGNYMIAHGVPAGHVKAKGCGPTHAYANNAQDRRAEISLE